MPKKGTNAMLSRCRQRFKFAWGYHIKNVTPEGVIFFVKIIKTLKTAGFPNTKATFGFIPTQKNKLPKGFSCITFINQFRQGNYIKRFKTASLSYFFIKGNINCS